MIWTNMYFQLINISERTMPLCETEVDYVYTVKVVLLKV